MLRLLVAAFIVVIITAAWHDYRELRAPAPVPEAGAPIHEAAAVHAGWLTRDSRVKRIALAIRDQIMRGMITGAIEGSAAAALHNSIHWSLASAIVIGIGEATGWSARLKRAVAAR